MNQQEFETVDYLTSEATEDQDFFAFADLALTDEQLAEVKGGPSCTWCGATWGNHNETMASDETKEAEEDFFQFADLSLTDEQLAEIKGGPGTGWCAHCGVVVGNHNETTASDDESDEDDTTLLLDDLLLAAETEEQVKGGDGSGWCFHCGVVLGNHNETMASDDENDGTLLLDDLLLAAETEEQVKGGEGSGWCYHCGVVVGNHNETTASDETEEAETESLDDLPVEDYEQVKGGPSGGITKLGSRRLILQGD